MNNVLVNSCCYNESTIAYLDGLNNRNLSLTIQQVVKFKVKEYTKSVPGEGPLPGLKVLLLCPFVFEREREREISVGKLTRWQQSVSLAPCSHTLSPCALTPSHFAQLCNSWDHIEDCSCTPRGNCLVTGCFVWFAHVSFTMQVLAAAAPGLRWSDIMVM